MFAADIYRNQQGTEMAGLEGQTVVVIGGTSGIGLATAQLAQEAGATVHAVLAGDPRVF